MNDSRRSKFGALPSTLGSAQPTGRLSRLRVPLQSTLADAQLDVERAQARLASPEARNVMGMPIVMGIVFAVLGTGFALHAALRAHVRENAPAVTPSALPHNGAPTGGEGRAGEVEVDVER